MAQAASDFDHSIRETLKAIVSGPISDWSWSKASLPSSLGGINHRSAVLHAPAAFVASSVQSRYLVEAMLDLPSYHPPHLDSALSALSSAASSPLWLSVEELFVSATSPGPLTRKSISSFSSLLPLLVPVPSPFITALPHASNWLNGVPLAGLGLYLQDQKFLGCLRYWLGVPLHSAPYSCPDCSSIAGEFGDHHISCGGNGDRITRHNAICDVLFSAAQSAALAPTREAPGLVPGSQSRPADILLPIWSRGHSAALDIHVISHLQRQTVQEAATTPGHALQVSIQRKLAAHLSACRAAGVEFVPFVAEALGGLAAVTITTIRAIGKCNLPEDGG